MQSRSQTLGMRALRLIILLFSCGSCDDPQTLDQIDFTMVESADIKRRIEQYTSDIRLSRLPLFPVGEVALP